MQINDISVVCMQSDSQNQNPVSKSLKPFVNKINVSLEIFLPSVLVAVSFSRFCVSTKSDRSSSNRELAVCLYETVNNGLKTNDRTFDFQIKQSDMKNSNKENTNH